MADPPRTLLGWLGRRDVLIRRFILAELLGPPRAAAWARLRGMPPSSTAPANTRASIQPAKGGAPPPK